MVVINKIFAGQTKNVADINVAVKAAVAMSALVPYIPAHAKLSEKLMQICVFTFLNYHHLQIHDSYKIMVNLCWSFQVIFIWPTVTLHVFWSLCPLNTLFLYYTVRFQQLFALIQVLICQFLDINI